MKLTFDVEFTPPPVEATGTLDDVLNDIMIWKRENLEKDFAEKFSSGKVPEAFGHVHAEQGEDKITWWVDGLSAIFHHGGSVHGTPVTVIRHYDASSASKAGRLMRPPWRTYQNVRYFFAMWYATGNDKYKAMALATQKKGGRVDITPHEFMEWKPDEIKLLEKHLEGYAMKFLHSQWTS